MSLGQQKTGTKKLEPLRRYDGETTDVFDARSKRAIQA